MPNPLLQKLESQLSQKLPFVAYKKPNEGKVKAMFQKDASLHHSLDFSEKGFVFAPFDSKSSAILLEPDRILEETFDPEEIPGIDEEISPLQNGNEKEIHIDLIKKGIAEIQSGKLKKVVLSRQIALECDKPPLDLFQQLLVRYPDAFCYLWYHPNVGMWLGASPELLLSVRNRQLYTSSLAGTQVYTGEENPAWGEKELEEQDMVTQYIREVLGNEVIDLNVSETKSVRAGNLWHLKTGISGRINNSDLSQIINLLHPTPAVCGLPRGRSRKFILENEIYDRKFYTGFLGELNLKEQRDRSRNSRNQENKAYKMVHNTTQLFVNLRCMKIDGDIATLYVGGGITQDSDPEKEWQETVDKSRTLLKVVLN